MANSTNRTPWCTSKRSCFFVIVVAVFIITIATLSHTLMISTVTRFLAQNRSHYQNGQLVSVDDKAQQMSVQNASRLSQKGNRSDYQNGQLVSVDDKAQQMSVQNASRLSQKGNRSDCQNGQPVSVDDKAQQMSVQNASRLSQKGNRSDYQNGQPVSVDDKAQQMSVQNASRLSQKGGSKGLKAITQEASVSKTNVSGVVSSVSTVKQGPKPLCPEKPVIEEDKVALNLTEVTYAELAAKYSDVLQRGGHYSPEECRARERVALIIPYRDREKNLHALLNNLIPFLIRQQLEFTIFLVEQTSDYRFNRCLMFNVGYVQAQKRGDFTCFIVHDTDLIPRDNRNLYHCHAKPRHLMLCRSNERWTEKLPYANFIGGVLALRKVHMDKSNGCSNSYYGWGLEDDDLGIRLRSHGFNIVRYPMEIAGYYSLAHDRQTDNPSRGKLKQTMRQRMKTDGLNTLNYTLVQQADREIYTWLLVKPPPPPKL